MLKTVHFHFVLLVDYRSLVCKNLSRYILCQDLLDVVSPDLTANERWRRKSSIVTLVILGITYLGLMLLV